MASVGLAPSSGLRESANHAVDELPEEMSEMKVRDEKEMEPAVVDGNGTEAGHIILTTVGGRNGQPKQVKWEPNISYICSRYYRAPELIFGATEYSTAIDVWSAGCVLAELLIGQPLFPGDCGVDALVEIIKILGTPTREEIKCMNPNYTEFKFPQIKAHPWHKIFHKQLPPKAVDLVSRLLQYSPNLRCSALDALTHKFFDELRDPNVRLPNGRFLPPLFNFKSHGTSIQSLLNCLCPGPERSIDFVTDCLLFLPSPKITGFCCQN